jgi:hypothetical protein
MIVYLVEDNADTISKQMNHPNEEHKAVYRSY